MKSPRILALLFVLVLSACGGGSVPAQSVETSTTTTVATTTSTTAPTSTTTTERPRSSLADEVTAVGSAIYDPEALFPDRRIPVALTIESLDLVEEPIVDVGVEPDGAMEIPGATEIGWYRFGSSPGEEGSAVLAAHIAYNGRNGVFRYLSRMEVGDTFVVHFDDGSTQAYEVFERAQYDKDELPLDRVFSKEGDPVVTLITCGGDFNRSLNSYEDNVVAYGVPIDA